MTGAREPLAPSTAYLDQMRQVTGQRAAAVRAPTSPHRGAPEALTSRIAEAVTHARPDLLGLSRHLHTHPEVAYEEHGSVAAVTELLERHGHRVHREYGGLPTAFRVDAGTTGPRVAVLAEYDALPGVGHACGHNVICSSAVGAFLALAGDVADLDGSVALIGTPAEEGGAGKERLWDAGAFEDVDAVVMLHPFSYDVAAHPFLGRRMVDVTYRGVAAHASAMPFMGRNALDAVVSAYTAVAALRQHIPSSDRVHGVITNGGQRPNVVPEEASLQFYVRSQATTTMKDLCDRLEVIFEASAAATGTAVEVVWDSVAPYLPIRHNQTLAARWATHQATRGRKVLPDGVVPETLTGSTDLGNLSTRMPAIHPMLAIAPEDVALHTADFARWAGSERADQGVVDGAFGLAAVTADYLSDARLRRAVHEEFDRSAG